MIDDIEFRGFSAAFGRWAYGYLCIMDPVFSPLRGNSENQKAKRKYYIQSTVFIEDDAIFKGNPIEVVPKTVGMYTGIKFEGRKIYTGMQLDVTDDFGDRKDVIVRGPAFGGFVYGGDGLPEEHLPNADIICIK